MAFLLISCNTSKDPAVILSAGFITNTGNNPIFSWKISAEQSVLIQSAYQLSVAQSPENLEDSGTEVWNSGRRADEYQQCSVTEGANLLNGQEYFARVKVWDLEGNEFTSLPVRFIIPLDYPEDWNAEWITWDYDPVSALPVFRKSFKLGQEKIRYSRLYISAPGFYEAWLNGEKLGENVLDPAQTNYEDYAYYSAIDIDTRLLKEENVIGIITGNGWYNQDLVWEGQMKYGQPVFICQLVVQFENGRKEVINSSVEWEWKSGPVIFSNIYAGETYNANSEARDWFDYEVSDESWENAIIAQMHPVELFGQFAEPVKRMEVLEVKNIIVRDNGKYIFDFGQNFTGWTRLSVRGEKGQQIKLRHVEVLDSNNNINPQTTGVTATGVVQTSTYICRGEGIETWEPSFTYYGFRYVEVDGLENAPSKELLKGIRLYSAVPKTGTFKCSDVNINMLHRMADYTMTGNIQGIPTDCPHREKCGWTGDVHAYAEALMYNYDVQRFMTKYMFDIRSSAREEKIETYYSKSFYDRSQVLKPRLIPTMVVPGKRTGGIASPDWGTVTVQLPWYLYMYYADSVILRQFYPDMKAWVDYVHGIKENGIITHGLGDWCPPTGVRNIDCPVPVSSTAFHILDVSIMKKVSALFRMKEDYLYYSLMLDELILAFNDTFYDPVNKTYGSQTADALALDLGLVPESERKDVAWAIIRNIEEKFDGLLSTGIFGLRRIFKVLAENGFEDEAFKLLTKKGPNSLSYMWEKFDATTLWEVLPLNSYNTRSHSHPMQAGYDAWFFSGIGGINPSPDSPGFKEIIFKPYMTKQLEFAEATHESPYGLIRSSWHNKNGKMKWFVTIPSNCKGTIFVPVHGDSMQVKINGKKVVLDDISSDFVNMGEFLPGDYELEIN